MKAKAILAKAQLQFTYWGEEIIRAEERGVFNETVKGLSSKWTTCACGKADRHIPYKDNGDGPLDKNLNDLGMTFCNNVCDNSFAEAATTLIAIEKRSIELALATCTF
jgi:hypothetical protein